ncbi:MAG: 5-oxoprolinase subunit PxpB [Opitutaceae bacterium]|jgi:inhibitor of KinA
MKLEPLGDAAVVATLGSASDAPAMASALGLAERLVAARARGIVDVVAAYATVTAFYDPLQFLDPQEDAYDCVCRLIETCGARSAREPSAAGGGAVDIPVCYGGDLGPDLDFVARRCGLDAAGAAALHAGAPYVVHAVGFTPGFPYLGGLPAALHTPRRDTPRARVPAGSVGIGGSQTGVYPVASPGGWQIIGRTPVALFRADGNPPALLKPGDRVRFRAISASEFDSWK